MDTTQQEKYTIWKKNTPLLYNQIQTSSLLWPSLSLDWLPDLTIPNSNTTTNNNTDNNTKDDNTNLYDQHRLLLSTFSDGLIPIESILLTNLNIFNLNCNKNLQDFDYLPSTGEFSYSLPLPHLKNVKDLTNVSSNNSIDLTIDLQINNGINNIDNNNNNSNSDSALINIGNEDNNNNNNNNNTTINDNKINNSLGLIQRIPHLGDINRIKHCPQNIDLIATTSNNGFVRIFDRTKKSNNLEFDNLNNSNIETSDILLKFHNSESWTIDWNLQKKFTLASASNDGSIAIWNLKDQFKSPPKQKFSTLDSKFRFSTCTLNNPSISIPAHDFGVNEVKWIPDHDSLLVSSGEDGICKVWDLRNGNNNNNNPIIQFTKFSNPLNTIDINPFDTFKFITGNSNGELIFLDIRNPKIQISKNQIHSDSITSTKFSPNLKDKIATSSIDSTVKILDNNNEIFVHNGHLLAVSDVVWCPSKKGILASCSYDNSVHIWEPIL